MPTDPTQVADSADPPSLQRRIPVIEQVERLLATSGRNDAEVIIGYTHRALAARVYDTQSPTPAQLSAVRRAVAKLVATGRASRGERMGSWPPSWLIDLTELHERRGKYGNTHTYANPGGVSIFRTPTDVDRAARQAWMDARAAREEGR